MLSMEVSKVNVQVVIIILPLNWLAQIFISDHMSGVLATKRIKKRKRFGQLSVNGRRRALMDIRKLFKIKEEEYSTTVSKLAGFIIKEVQFKI